MQPARVDAHGVVAVEEADVVGVDAHEQTADERDRHEHDADDGDQGAVLAVEAAYGPQQAVGRVGVHGLAALARLAAREEAQDGGRDGQRDDERAQDAEGREEAELAYARQARERDRQEADHRGGAGEQDGQEAALEGMLGHRPGLAPRRTVLGVGRHQVHGVAVAHGDEQRPDDHRDHRERHAQQRHQPKCPHDAHQHGAQRDEDAHSVAEGQEEHEGDDHDGAGQEAAEVVALVLRAPDLHHRRAHRVDLLGGIVAVARDHGVHAVHEPDRAAAAGDGRLAEGEPAQAPAVPQQAVGRAAYGIGNALGRRGQRAHGLADRRRLARPHGARQARREQHVVEQRPRERLVGGDGLADAARQRRAVQVAGLDEHEEPRGVAGVWRHQVPDEGVVGQSPAAQLGQCLGVGGRVGVERAGGHAFAGVGEVVGRRQAQHALDAVEAA